MMQGPGPNLSYPAVQSRIMRWVNLRPVAFVRCGNGTGLSTTAVIRWPYSSRGAHWSIQGSLTERGFISSKDL